MKRKVMLLMALAIVFTGVYAQGVKFGVKGGLNISSLGDYEHVIAHEDAELDEKLGLYAGAFAQFYFSKNFGLETGLFYTQLGGRDKENDWNEQFKVTANPAYLQLPVSAFYRFNLTPKLAFYPSFGLYAGYGLSGKFKVKGTVGSVDVGTENDYFDNFARKFDAGITVGVNFQYSKFLLGVGYDQGFLRVNKDKSEYGDNAYNSNLRVTVGVVF